MSDLFSAAAAERLRQRAPLAARLRPRSLDEIVGQTHLVGERGLLRRLVDRGGTLPSLILWGPAGTGKTSLAEVVAGSVDAEFVRLSAVTSGVKELREAVEGARLRLVHHDRRTIVFVDEIHRFSRSQQDALLPSVEEGVITLIGATTENPMFEVNGPLRSRATLLRLEPLGPDDLRALVERGCRALGCSVSDEAIDVLLDRSVGDGRSLLVALEVAWALVESHPRAGETDAAGHVVVEKDHVTAAFATSALRYGIDDHYDVVSAFIKSIRGSAVDAALHWLARMLESGEDPKFIARRLVILASEDVGIADPMSLVVAVAAAEAVQFVGLPEAQLALGQAVVHLARAPKSAAVSRAVWAAREDVARGRVAEVPAHLRDAHYSGAARLGFGRDYVSPHDDPESAREQRYLPAGFDDVSYFRSDSGRAGTDS